eukprot:491849-Pyramimonas_sp.AAC.1
MRVEPDQRRSDLSKEACKFTRSLCQRLGYPRGGEEVCYCARSGVTPDISDRHIASPKAVALVTAPNRTPHALRTSP